MKPRHVLVLATVMFVVLVSGGLVLTDRVERGRRSDSITRCEALNVGARFQAKSEQASMDLAQEMAGGEASARRRLAWQQLVAQKLPARDYWERRAGLDCERAYPDRSVLPF